MYKLRIFDKETDSDSILSLGIVIDAVEKVITNIYNSKWVINRGFYGYGEIICSYEDELRKTGEISIDEKFFFPILKAGNEYLYNGCLTNKDLKIQFGVSDSTYNFVTSCDRLVLVKIQSFFYNSNIIEIL